MRMHCSISELIATLVSCEILEYDVDKIFHSSALAVSSGGGGGTDLERGYGDMGP